MNYFSLLNKKLETSDSFNFNEKYVHFKREENLNHWDTYFDSKNKIQMIILGRPTIEVSDWREFNENEKNYITKIC